MVDALDASQRLEGAEELENVEKRSVVEVEPGRGKRITKATSQRTTSNTSQSGILAHGNA
eukprot:2807858-Prymnesium_polylepis.2